MVGIVDSAETGKFLSDRKSSKQQARVTMHYETTCTFEELVLDQLKDAARADICIETNATHFVSGILYGTDVVGVFEREVSRNESHTDVEKEIKLMVESFPGVGLDDAGSVDIPEMDREAARKLTCTVYGDIAGSKSAISYEEAVKAYHELIKHEENPASEVPKKVWLHPLSTLDPILVRPLHETSASVVTEVHRILEDLHDLDVRTCDLSKNQVCSSFSGLQKQLLQFKQMMLEHRKNLLKKIALLVPRVRSGEVGEELLTNILEEMASSPFHQPNLSFWISEKEKEVKPLGTYLEFFKGIQFASSSEELDQLVNSLEHDRVVCFSLMAGNDQDQQLDQMNAYLRTGQWSQEISDAKSWCENRDLTNDLKIQARNFKSFAQANDNNDSTKFVVTTVNKRRCERVATILLYIDGHQTDFELPGKPGKPHSSSESDCSVALEWTKSPYGGDNLQSYTVHYVPADCSSTKWKTVKTSGPNSSLTVSGLDAKTAYLFKVNGECEAGKSAISETSDPIETASSAATLPAGHLAQESGELKDRKDDSHFGRKAQTQEETCATNTAMDSSDPAVTCEAGSSAVYHPADGITPKTDERKGRKDPTLKKAANTPRSGSNSASNSKGKKEAFFVPYRPVEKLVSRSRKIHSGSPSIYKIPMKERMRRPNSMIAKQSFGKPVPVTRGVTEKVLMVVGATGAGKSTLINGMVNYILGVEWKDHFRLKLIAEETNASQANSQTKDITAYTFYPMEGSGVPYTFTIIDTPGFGDTDGLKRDKVITAQIKEFFSIPPPNGIDHLDGVGFVTQASLARLTPTQEYIFGSILSIFGNDVGKNIFMMLTFADGQHPPVLEAIKKANIPSNNYFKFNNSALFAETEETEEGFDAMFWKMGFRSFKNFFAEFGKSESVSLRLTKEVLQEREQLETLIEGLNPQITMGLNKIEEMRQEELVLQHHEKEIETHKEFKYIVVITKPRHVDLAGTGRHTTTCLRCNFTCHTNCAIADDREKRGCVSMGADGNCTVCTGHCNWTQHRNLPYLIEYEKVTETRTSEDLKKKYEKAITGKTRVEGMIVQLEEFLQDVHTRVLTMIHRAQQSLHRLDEIALKPNPLTQVEYLELLVESEKQEARYGWKQRVDYYEEAKRSAVLLSKVKDVKDVKESEHIIERESRSGERWYHRFKFW